MIEYFEGHAKEIWPVSFYIKCQTIKGVTWSDGLFGIALGSFGGWLELRRN